MVTARSSVSPGTTWRRKRARSIPPNSGNFPLVALIQKHRYATELGERLDHEHAGQGRPAGEVTGEERLVPRQHPCTRGGDAGLDGLYLAHEEKGGPVWENIGGLRRSGHDLSAAARFLVDFFAPPAFFATFLAAFFTTFADVTCFAAFVDVDFLAALAAFAALAGGAPAFLAEACDFFAAF